MRILQLTLLAIIFMAISGIMVGVVESVTPGAMARAQAFGDTGDWVGDLQSLEIALLPIVVGLYVCWGSIKVLRLRRVVNEVEDSLRPMQAALKGYMLFLAPVCGLIHMVMRNWKAGALHIVIGIIGFATFIRKEKAKEEAQQEILSKVVDQEEGAYPLGCSIVPAIPS
jgi:hypothetical protein